MGLEPLHLTITAEASKAAWRIGENPNTVISKKLKTTVNKVSLSTMEDWRVGRAHLPGDGDNWFADGSKNRDGVGAGVYGRNSNTSLAIPLGPHLTVLQTEITNNEKIFTIILQEIITGLTIF